MSEPFLGQIKMFGGNFAPRGWALCDGQLLPISQNQSLFAILGTTYGGDGRTSFALPDLRGRVSLHPGQGPGLSPYSLGNKSGVEIVTLAVNEIPAHNHKVEANSNAGNVGSPVNAIPGAEIPAGRGDPGLGHADLLHGVGVSRHIGHEDQDALALLHGEALRHRQRHVRDQQPLHDGIGRQVHVHDGPVGDPVFLERRLEEMVVVED